jgi:hypothetical protein
MHSKAKKMEALAQIWVLALLSPKERARGAALKRALKLQAKLDKLSRERAKTRALAIVLESHCDQERTVDIEFGDN